MSSKKEEKERKKHNLNIARIVFILYLQLDIHIKHCAKKGIFMSNKGISNFHTLPVELVYRVLDNLDPITILLSCRNICIRLNAITDSYHRYKVKD